MFYLFTRVYIESFNINKTYSSHSTFYTSLMYILGFCYDTAMGIVLNSSGCIAPLRNEATGTSGYIRKYYSTIPNSKLKTTLSLQSWDEFIEWFRGFTDGEGSFYISKNKGNIFEFHFEITLHVDDIGVINYIHNTLGIGKVYIKKNRRAVFLIRNKGEILVIIQIFSKNPLNTTKHLNFLAWKRAYLLYVSKKSKQELKPVISGIINEINKQRTNFYMPKHNEIRITANWLLGFIEAEGSFSYSRGKNTFTFILVQKDNLALMHAIKEYLYKLDSLPHCKDIEGELTSLYSSQQVSSKGNVYNYIYVRRLNYIRTVLIPLLDSLDWHSKKEKDYQDWKSIINIVELGLHYTDEGKEIINRILAQMNNNRLSTAVNEWSAQDRTYLLKDIAVLISKGSNYEIKSGKTYIKSLNRMLSTNKKVAVLLIERNTGDIINSFDSISGCARFLETKVTTAHERVKNNTDFFSSAHNKTVYLKRVKN